MTYKDKLIKFCNNKIDKFIILGDPYKEKDNYSLILDILNGDKKLEDLDEEIKYDKVIPVSDPSIVSTSISKDVYDPRDWQ